MASFVKARSGSPMLASPDACYHSLDVDQFINYDQLPSLSPSIAPLTPQAAASSATANPNNTLLPPMPVVPGSSQEQPVFAGPSHQYDLYKQQTGPPVGALSNILAVNQAAGFNPVRNHSSFAFSFDDALAFDPADDLMAFNPPTPHQASFSAGSDGEMDLDPTDAATFDSFLLPESSTSSAAEFIDPAALAGPEGLPLPDLLPLPLPATTASAAGRLYPGMHQQQAARAKAQQEKQQQQQRAQAPARPSPAHPRAKDPLVEEKISKLLSSMRNASVAGSSDDGLSPSGSGPAHLTRSKKEEDEMDEDERLLASEEGKKLTSKERRQLRNKVSARAFRSRRKEYIGQLEAELATKANEAHDLRQDNQLLREENTRLSDLTRMLLSSPAFSTFLDTLGAANLPSAAPVEPISRPAASDAVVTSTVAATMPKDPNPTVAAAGDDLRVGMTLLPDQPVDPLALDGPLGHAWGMGDLSGGMWGLNRPQVFAVTELPAGPAVDAIDPETLSGKSNGWLDSIAAPEGSKMEMPFVEAMPSLTKLAPAPLEMPVATAVASMDGVDECDRAFALYADPPTTAKIATSGAAQTEPAVDRARHLLLVSDKERLARHLALLSLGSELDMAGSGPERLQRLCANLDAACQRIARITSHLPPTQ
ncbi:MAG: hypothetical protein M1826_007762 [Phylliscum demangeonii]|nr:MAG: hypothetical protein M1826_007762 [Phylliscum demangeonii]